MLIVETYVYEIGPTPNAVDDAVVTTVVVTPTTVVPGVSPPEDSVVTTEGCGILTENEGVYPEMFIGDPYRFLTPPLKAVYRDPGTDF